MTLLVSPISELSLLENLNSLLGDTSISGAYGVVDHGKVCF